MGLWDPVQPWAPGTVAKSFLIGLSPVPTSMTQAFSTQAALKYHCPHDWGLCRLCPGLALGLQKSLVAMAIAPSPEAGGPESESDPYTVAPCPPLG